MPRIYLFFSAKNLSAQENILFLVAYSLADAGVTFLLVHMEYLNLFDVLDEPSKRFVCFN